MVSEQTDRLGRTLAPAVLPRRGALHLGLLVLDVLCLCKWMDVCVSLLDILCGVGVSFIHLFIYLFVY